MSMELEASRLIGKKVKVSGKDEIGVIVSFIMDSSGQVNDVLIERTQGGLEKHPIEMLQIEGDEIFLSSRIERKLKILSEKLPIIRKKRRVLDDLSRDKIIPQSIFESLVKKFDKTLKEMKDEAKNLIDEIEKEAEIEEDRIKALQMARAFLEIEHAIGNISEETYKRSIVALLKDTKNAQQRRLELMRTKERINELLEEKPEVVLEEKQKAEASTEEQKTPKKQEEKEENKAEAIPVRISS